MDQQSYSPKHEEGQFSTYAQMSHNEADEEFRKEHQKYLAAKIARKKEIRRIISHEVPPSSSSEDQFDQKPQNLPSLHQETFHAKKEGANVRKTAEKSEEGKVEKMAVMVAGRKPAQWESDLLLIEAGVSLNLGKNVIKLQSLSKIKVIHETMGARIKLTTTSGEFYLSSAAKENMHGLDPNYYIFSRILNAKLQSLHHSLDERAANSNDFPEELISKSLMYGKLYKKSQVLGNWEERFIVINDSKEGILSYKKLSEKPSMAIGKGSVKEIWTRFGVEKGMLIIKMHYHSTKTEFAIPICNFASSHSWLYFFYCMMG